MKWAQYITVSPQELNNAELTEHSRMVFLITD